MATNTNTKINSPGDGKRLLYRLLLIAVSVVYALVFVLDYVLQLRFTYYLLLSLFAFILITLFYMWYKVTGKPDPEEEEPNANEELNHSSPFSAAIDPMDWPEPIFIVNARTGLTISANNLALAFFEASSLTELTGVDLTSLFSKPWTPDANRLFREQLQA